MKKIILLMFILGSFIYSNSLNKVNTLEAKVTEKTFVNKNNKEKKYVFLMKYPNKVYKEMLSPKLNIGEKYIYNGNKKQVFYPLIGDSFIEEIDNDENYILQAIKRIKEGKKTYVMENNEIKEFQLEENIKVVFLEYKNIESINFPHKIEIYEDKNLISQLVFSDVKINKTMNDKIFIIK